MFETYLMVLAHPTEPVWDPRHSNTFVISMLNLLIAVAKPVKTNVKEVIIHQEIIEELPKVPIKEVTFSIEPQSEAQRYKCCISEEPEHDLLKANRERRPVVLFNKDDPKPIVTKTVIFEQKKILPDVALYRWHRGFRCVLKTIDILSKEMCQILSNTPSASAWTKFPVEVIS